MCAPLLAAGIEKLDDMTSIRIDSGEIRALVQIAIDASQREVCEAISATVLFGKDVFHLEPGDRGLRFS